MYLIYFWVSPMRTSKKVLLLNVSFSAITFWLKNWGIASINCVFLVIALFFTYRVERIGFFNCYCHPSFSIVSLMVDLLWANSLTRGNLLVSSNFFVAFICLRGSYTNTFRLNKPQKFRTFKKWLSWQLLVMLVVTVVLRYVLPVLCPFTCLS